MKLNRIFLTAALIGGLLGQRSFADSQPTPDKAPAAPATAPVAQTEPAPKKASAAKKDAALELRTVPLVPGPAVVDARNVNVRGKAGLRGEVITRLSKGDAVTVIEEITLKHSAADEPSAWAKIAFPTNAHVWVNTSYVNATNKTVIPKKLNVRTGPGENYSVAGRLSQGDAVSELRVKDNWMEIEAPANAYAFMAAQYLKQEIPTAPEPVLAQTPVPETPAVAEPPATAPEAPAIAPEPAAAPAPTAPEPLPKRIVQREGIVKGTWSIQAPTRFALVSPDNGVTINYLYTSSSQVDLSRWKGMHIIVTGEEGLDERWKNTPVITIQRIQVLE